MKKILTRQSGYALMVVLIAVVVVGLLTPVMLTTATYGLKNTKSTNDNINARYLADTAYQETLNEIQQKRLSGIADKSDVDNFIKRITNKKITLNRGEYVTILYRENSTLANPEIITKSSTSTVEYKYYLRSIGKVDNQSVVIDYYVLFSENATTILYEKSNERNTRDKLPIYPDNLKYMAQADNGLNGKIQNEISDKINGVSHPKIAFKYSLTPIPTSSNNKVSSINLANNSSLNINGDLYVENDFMTGNNVSVTIKGNLYIGSNFNVGNNVKLYVTGDIIAKNSINFNNNIHFDIGGNMFVQGELKVDNNASDSKIEGSLYVLNNISIGNNSQLIVSEDIVGNNININNNGFLETKFGEVLVKNEFNAGNNAVVVLKSGLKVGTNLKLSNNVQFNFAKNLYITNTLDLGNNAEMLLIKAAGGSAFTVDNPIKL